ncbi:MAG: hypothetical protein IJJ33_03185 [Victivallales bacterium]|nr:hypothetical protein [Victivallales bacterium]
MQIHCFSKAILISAFSIGVAFLSTSCVAIEETARGTFALAKEKMGGGDSGNAPALAPRPGKNADALLEAEIASDKFSRVWRGMDELVTDYEDVLSGNDKSWFGRRSKSLTRSALKMIASKAGLESYEKILDLQQKIADKEKEKNNLVAGRLGYPTTSMNPFAMTREKCDRKIQETDKEIGELKLAVDQQSTILLSDLNRHGQVMDAKHLKYLLTAAGGDDLLQMMNLAMILKQVQYAIGKQIKTEQFNGAQLQRYVGIQLVLLLAYQQAHTIGLENIKETFLPRLRDIQKKAEANLQEAQALRQSSQEGANYLEQNLRLSQNTLQIAEQYRVALQEMARSLENSRAKVDRNVAVTRNTFKTVTTGASLLQLIQESSQDYSELISFNPPILDTIYSDQMMEAFQQVSSQLKK